MEEVEAKLEAEESKQRGHWRRTLQRFCTPVFLEALILTFLAGQQKPAYCKPALHRLLPCKAALHPPATVQANIAPPAGPAWCSQRSSPGQTLHRFALFHVCAHAHWILVQQPVSAPDNNVSSTCHTADPLLACRVGRP